MINYYPIKNQNQHESLDLEYEESIKTPMDYLDDNYNDKSSDIDIKMSDNLFSMRREFKRNIKKLRNLYTDKEPKTLVYKFNNTKPRHRSFAKTHFTKNRLAG